MKYIRCNPRRKRYKDMVHIIIADEHAVVRAGIKSILEASVHYRLVDQVSAGKDLLQKIHAHPNRYDMVILDIAMPGYESFDLIREIHVGCPDLPIVIFTLKAEEIYSVRGFKLGVSAFIRKDSQPADIIQAVKTVASGRKYLTSYQAELMADYLWDSPHQRFGHFEKLTERELQVLHFLVHGEPKEEIAKKLEISKNTISNHRNNILKKLKLRNNAELTRYAMQNGLAR